MILRTLIGIKLIYYFSYLYIFIIYFNLSSANQKKAENILTKENGKECVELISDCSIGSKKPHWGNCRMYIICTDNESNKKWIEKNCDKDEIFDHKKKECVNFEKAICFIPEKEYCLHSKMIFFSLNKNQSNLYTSEDILKKYKSEEENGMNLPMIICIIVGSTITIFSFIGIFYCRKRQEDKREKKKFMKKNAQVQRERNSQDIELDET